MTYDQKQVIIDHCKRYGEKELIDFILEKGISDIVDMLDRNGDGNDLTWWFDQAEGDSVDHYVDYCELKMNAERELSA